MEKYDLFGTINGLNGQLYGPYGIIERANSHILRLNAIIESANSDGGMGNLTYTINGINGILNQLTENKDELDRRVAVVVTRDNRQKGIELLAKMKDCLETVINVNDFNTKISRIPNEKGSLDELFHLRGARKTELDLIKNAYREYTRENNINNIAAYLGENAENLNRDLHDAERYFGNGNYGEFAVFVMGKLLERIDDLQARLDDEKEFVDTKVRDVLSDIENLENELK